MSNFVSPLELYEAARETCLRLYLANGGNKRDIWNIQPFPGTAAISQAIDAGNGRRVWTLCMPAFPLSVKVPRITANLIAGYTVHELLHALWTSWNCVARAKALNVGLLLNAIEDCRIEAKASHGGLRMVSEARRLLEMLNRHVHDKARANPNFRYGDPNQFAFVLTLVLFSEKLGYQCDFPRDWRHHVAPHMLPLFDLALSRFDGLGSTEDALQLAQDLSQAAQALTQPPAEPPAEKGEAEKGEGSEGEAEKGEGSEGEAEKGEGSEGEAEKGEGSEGEAEKGEGSEDTTEATQKPADGQRPSSGSKGEAKGEKATGEAPTGLGGQHGGPESGDPMPADISDATQDYREVSLDHLGSKQAIAENAAYSPALNVETPRTEAALSSGNPAWAGAVIASPAKLKRQVTLAVKSPERVGYERFQTNGRLDMRNLAGLLTRQENIFRRRVEEEGQEAVVTLLLDVSSSMADSGRIDAARALGLHMGDALKAAGVRFEVSAFKHVRNACVMSFPKALDKPWTAEARAAVAGLRPHAGTAMLPAIKDCAARLAKDRNATRRILMVLTDGEDMFPPEANALNTRFWRDRGIEIFGLGLMLYGWQKDNIRQSFNGAVVFVDDCRELSTVGLAELAKMLGKPVQRAA
jgi:Mg-chelatase subunit ChlD